MTVRIRTSPGSRRVQLLGRRMLAAVFFGGVASTSLPAQTDYYNTSAGRPLRVEDALPLEYRGVELNLAPLRWESARNSTYRWSLEPEIAVGILPRTQLQIGVPFAFVDGPSSSARGVAGLELSALHALNAETSIPALAVAADVLLPVGPLGPGAAYGTFKGILTRTFRVARVHANAQVTAGPTPDSIDTEALDVEASRWLAGIAVDKTFPLRSILLSVEGFAEQPLASSAPVTWNAGAGARVQLSPRWAFDAGVGRRLTGNDQAWYVTFGSAYALGIP
jgi:hypothetical protein